MEILLIVFLIKHFIIDFVLQTEYQWKNKGTFMHPGGLLHSGLHGISAYAILSYFGVDEALQFALLDGLSHYFIDFTKTNTNKLLKVGPESQTFWVLVGLDQLAHYFVYIYIIF
jgi:Protein of unknown function (DUF3307)